MKPELDNALVEKYPVIFRDRHAPVTQTPMGWGFDCGDGWYNIIDAACSQIENYLLNKQRDLEYHEKYLKEREMAKNGDWAFLEKQKEQNPEWHEKNPEWIEQLKREYLGPIPEWRTSNITEIDPVVATQIKEKFGTLRFYYDGGDDYIRGVVAMAERMSSKICEICGSPGKIRTGGWLRTLCDHHAESSNYTTNDNEENNV